VPRSYPPEFRRKVLDLLKAGRTVTQLANDLQISGQTIYVWRRQESIDNGELSGVTSTELAELSKARRRIAELEAELAIHRRAVELLKEAVPPKARFAAIKTLPLKGSPSTCVAACWTCRCPATTPGSTGHYQPGRCATPG
jgi:transposase-like protein